MNQWLIWFVKSHGSFPKHSMYGILVYYIPTLTTTKTHHSWIGKYTIPIEWVWHLGIAYNIHPTPQSIRAVVDRPPSFGASKRKFKTTWSLVPLVLPQKKECVLVFHQQFGGQNLYFSLFWAPIWMVDVYGKWWQMNTQMLRGMGIFTSRHFPLFMWPFFYLSGIGK